MTADQQLAAIRERLVLFDPDRWDAVEVRALVFDLDELAAERPTPEPLADTLPPGPIACPTCGECDQWTEWAYVAVSQDIRITDEEAGTYAWQISDDPTWEDQKHDYWTCVACEYVASPEIDAALTIRANAS